MSVISLRVDEARRTLSPVDSSVFVVRDKNVDIVRFSFLTGFADAMLDENSAVRVMYQRPGETEVRARTLIYQDTDGMSVFYDWELQPSDLTEKGVLTCAVCVLRLDDETEEWHTTPYRIKVLDTIHTDDSDEADETTTPTVAQRVAILESVIQSVAGSAPEVVNSVSDMTDTEKIYILTTDNNWYYYDGSTWTAGGEYGAIATDRTLTESGVPADAKSTGDKIREIEAALPSVSPSLSVFRTFGIIGDRYSCGSLYFSDHTDKWRAELSWAHQMGRHYGVTCIDYAYPAASTRSWPVFAQYGLPKLLQDDARDLYILGLGINDYSQIRSGIFTVGTVADMVDDYTHSPDTFFGNYNKIIGHIRNHAPYAGIVLLSYLHPTDGGKEVLNPALTAIATKAGIPFINLEDDDFFASDFYTTDTQVSGYPTAVGHAGMATAIERLIAKSIKENPSHFANIGHN